MAQSLLSCIISTPTLGQTNPLFHTPPEGGFLFDSILISFFGIVSDFVASLVRFGPVSKKNRNIFFRKRGGGKGRSEIFRKFIGFGIYRLPLAW